MANFKTIFKSQNMTIKFKNRFKEIFKSASERNLQNGMDQIVKNDILALIDKGLSPVKGNRSFAKYKNPKKYPGKLKQSNKPNLKLTGEMLSNYKAKTSIRERLSVTVGIHKDASARSRLLAGVHNNGDNPNIVMRPFVPKQSDGETFTARINSAVRKLFREIIREALKKKGDQK